MPSSMRRESARYRQNLDQKEIERQNRERAAELLRASEAPNISEISRATNVSRRTVNRIRAAIDNNATETLQKLLSPVDNQRGRPHILSPSEEKMLVSRLLYAAKRGFGLDVEQLREAMADIANDGRRGYANNLPTMATVRRFRAQNREVTYRMPQEKELAKVVAENPEHAKTLKVALESVESEYPGIFEDPNCIWNMDETSIDGKGNIKKIFCSSIGSNSGSKVDSDIANGKHVTCVVTTSASGKKIPPFFIIEGVNIMKKFFDTLNLPAGRNAPPEGFEKYFSPDWCDEDVGFAMSPNGSMTKDVLVAYMDHFNKHVRKIVPAEKQLVLILDGHKSRRGIEWIKNGIERNICIVQGPANTTHYLQPADQYINKVLKKFARAFHDALYAYIHNSTCVQFKIMKCIYGYSKIVDEIVQKSWDKTGLYPVDYRFVSIAETMWAGRNSRATETTVGYIDLTLSHRETDASIVNKMKEILEKGEITNAEKVQKVSILAANASSANNILQNAGIVRRATAPERPNGAVGPNFGIAPSVVKAGQAAVYLTKKEAVAAMESKANALEDAMKRKEERKRVAAERKQARENERATKKARGVGGQNKQ